MKTTTSINRASRMATVLFSIIVYGVTAWAQPYQNKYQDDDLSDSFDRLETLMNGVEQAVKYEAPGSEYDEIQAARDRLEILANKTDNEIRYKVPDLEQIQSMEYTVQENNPKKEATNVIAFKTGKLRK